MDIDSYFRRIDYDGPRAATLATLNAILFGHVRAIPFENLSVLLGQPISLEPADVLHKLVHEKRGGILLRAQHPVIARALGTWFLGNTVERTSSLPTPRALQLTANAPVSACGAERTTVSR